MFFPLVRPGLPVCLVFLNTIQWTAGFYVRNPTCSYEAPKMDEVILQVRQTDLKTGDAARRSRSVVNGADPRSPPNLRISIYYDNKSIDDLPSLEQRLYVRERLVPEAVQFWQEALSLRHPSDIRIRLNRKCETSKYFLHTSTRQHSCFGGCRAVTKCGEVTVPDEHLNRCHYCSSNDTTSCSYSGPEDGPGVVNADFVLYVSAVHTERCFGRDTVAYAAHCQQEDTLDRPIAGHVNLCPQGVSVREKDQEVLVSTVKHEILHALGFSAGLFAFFRDDDGRPLTPRNEVGKPVTLNKDKTYYEWSERVAKWVTRTDWWTRFGRINHTVHVMVTPKVQEEARKHFGCNSLEGAELENQGVEGTAYTHWEKRVFENEAMTGTHTQSPSYSRLTLALMEDTGWYIANYSVADTFLWGWNLGCEFATKSCGEWIVSRERAKLPMAPFCMQLRSNSKPSDTTTTCTMTRRSIGLCNLKNYGRELPPEYQYFDSYGSRRDATSGIGGSVELADYCPYPQEFEWNNTADGRERDSRCTLKENTPDRLSNAAMESYGPDSACFNHKGSWTQRRCSLKRTFERLGAGCHQYECREGLLWLHVSNSSYPCFKSGQVIRIRSVVDGWLHEGAIVCPACQDICEDSFECLPEPDQYPNVDDPLIDVPCTARRTYGQLSITLIFIMLATFLWPMMD